MFESINVCFFPAPCKDVQDLDPNTTSEEFKESVKDLKEAILGQLSEPRRFGSVVVSSQNVDVLVKKFVKELEDGDIVHVKSAVCQLQREVVDEAKRIFEESLINAYKQIDVPIKAGLEELLTEERDTLLDAFRKSTAKVDLEAVYRDDVLEHWTVFADRKLDVKRKENQLATHSRMAEQTRFSQQRKKSFRSSLEKELRRGGDGSWAERKFEEKVQTPEENKRRREKGLLIINISLKVPS